MRDYRNAIASKYGLKPEDMSHFSDYVVMSRSAKEPLFKALGGTDAAGMGRRIPIRTPEVYQERFLAGAFHALCKDMPESIREGPLYWFLTKAMLGVLGPNGKPLIDLVNNRMHDGAKVSKHLIKLFNKQERDGPFWDTLPLTNIRDYLGTLPDGSVTYDLVVQQIFNLSANMKTTCYISFELDDFLNCSETDKFYSCFKVRGEQERSPWSLSLSPNIGIVRLENKKRELIARSWLAVNPQQKVVAMFGSYGAMSNAVREAVVDFVVDKLGWRAQFVSGTIRHNDTGCRYSEFRDKSGIVLGIDAWMGVAGSIIERNLVKLDPIVAMAFEGPAPNEVKAYIPHAFCPVCGKHGPETPRQIICAECAKKAEPDEDLLSGDFTLSDMDKYLGVAA